MQESVTHSRRVTASVKNQMEVIRGVVKGTFSGNVNGTGATEKPYSMSQKAYVMVPDYNTVDKAKSLMEKVRNGEVVTQEEADAPVSGSTSTDSTSTETVTEPGTVAAETQAATDTTAADGTTTEGAADTTTQQ